MEMMGPEGMANVGYNDKKKKKKLPKKPMKPMRHRVTTELVKATPTQSAIYEGKKAATDMGAQIDDNPLDLRK